jgi:membrane associated rhomboid family serine protease
MVQRFGFIPAQATRLSGVTFVTAFFLHSGIIHLVGNMYFLLVFGDNVEDFLRPGRYLALIILAALVGDLFHLAADPRSQIPSIGASGGIAGVIVFYALKFPHIHLAFLMRWGFIWFRWIRLPAWFALILWIVFQGIGACEQKAGISSVSSFAHLGGALAGLIAWLVWRGKSNEPNANVPPSPS